MDIVVLVQDVDARAAYSSADWLASKQTKGSLIGLKLLLQFNQLLYSFRG